MKSQQKTADVSTSKTGDVVFVESRDSSAHQRNVVGLQGHYRLESWRDADGDPKVFSCTVQKMTAHAIEISGPVTGNVGERVEINLDLLGQFEGPVVRTGQRALVMKIVATADDRNKVAGKIAWIEKKTPDARRYERFIPVNPHSIVKQSSGTTTPCQIIDYSISGAGVYCEFDPPLGSVLKLGAVLGRVVRKFSGGFAIAFVSLQSDRHAVEALIAQPLNET